MGKYTLKKINDNDASNNALIQLTIANELAESNRLKRIKRKLDYDENITNEEIRGLLVESEDQD